MNNLWEEGCEDGHMTKAIGYVGKEKGDEMLRNKARENNSKKK